MPSVTIHAFLVSPGRNGADCTCHPFKAGDEAGMQSAADAARDQIGENAENLELGDEAQIEFRVIEPDECQECGGEDDDCECRQTSGNPEFKPAREKKEEQVG